MGSLNRCLGCIFYFSCFFFLFFFIFFFIFCQIMYRLHFIVLFGLVLSLTQVSNAAVIPSVDAAEDEIDTSNGIMNPTDIGNNVINNDINDMDIGNNVINNDINDMDAKDPSEQMAEREADLFDYWWEAMKWLHRG